MSDLMLKYFVLKPSAKEDYDQYAKASRIAMLAYAKAIESFNPPLAKDLIEWVQSIEDVIKRKTAEDKEKAAEFKKRWAKIPKKEQKAIGNAISHFCGDYSR